MIAALVSICCIVCLVNTIEAIKAGGAFPFVTLVLTVVTGICTVAVWRGVMHMDD